ncbi:MULTISPECIES: DUF4184 family protein [Eikenella]|uniref:DUF4184 family protein n=1 Tax=Eikenella TaxID=538 RepID=UPI000B09A4B1|nr:MULTISPECIES: DUF4184 family protein [Eikenella]
MPFTLAHPVAMLPFTRRRVHFPAMVIDSLAPDFVYFLHGRAVPGGHSWPICCGRTCRCVSPSTRSIPPAVGRTAQPKPCSRKASSWAGCTLLTFSGWALWQTAVPVPLAHAATQTIRLIDCGVLRLLLLCTALCFQVSLTHFSSLTALARLAVLLYCLRLMVW